MQSQRAYGKETHTSQGPLLPESVELTQKPKLMDSNHCCFEEFRAFISRQSSCQWWRGLQRTWRPAYLFCRKSFALQLQASLFPRFDILFHLQRQHPLIATTAHVKRIIERRHHTHNYTSVIIIFLKIRRQLGMASRKSIEKSNSNSTLWHTLFLWSSICIPDFLVHGPKCS